MTSSTLFSNAKVTTPFDVDNKYIGTHFTYFDSTGRLLVVLEKSNVVREHELPIQIEYEYSSFRLLQKPIVASVAIFLLFAASISLNKMSFTIRNEKVKLYYNFCMYILISYYSLDKAQLKERIKYKKINKKKFLLFFYIVV